MAAVTYFAVILTCLLGVVTPAELPFSRRLGADDCPVGMFKYKYLGQMPGNATLFAGSVIGQEGTADGIGTSSRFNSPYGIAFSSSGSFALLADSKSHTIRRIETSTKQVSTLAGNGNAALVDGTGIAAEFKRPTGVAISSDDTFALIADKYNDAIRHIVIATGVVTTLPCKESDGQDTKWSFPTGVAISPDRTWALITDNFAHTVRRLTLSTNVVVTEVGSGAGRADGYGTYATFYNPYDVSISPDASFALISDSGNHRIRKLTLSNKKVETLAGGKNDAKGDKDGIGTDSLFDSPFSLSISPDGQFALVADYANHLLRYVVVASGEVTTLAGARPTGDASIAHGVGSYAAFGYPASIAISPVSNGLTTTAHAIVSDTANNQLRWITIEPRCRDCEVGRYQDSVGQDSCINCAKGKFVPTTKSDEESDCIMCGVGKYIDILGSDSEGDCIECRVGRYIDVAGSDDASDCIGCGAGQYVTVTGSVSASACISCGAGSVTDTLTVVGGAWCKACAAGKHSSQSTIACIDCVLGKYSAVLGSTTVSNCITCPLGEIGVVPGVGACTPCEPGRFSAVANVNACIACGAGSVTNTLYLVGASTCALCAKGTYSTAATIACADCAAGRYIDVTGSDADSDCIGCATGKFVSSTGSTAVGACTFCPAGKYAASVGTSDCTACDYGQYQSVAGQTSCVHCAKGKYGPGQTMTSEAAQCKECVDGQYQPASGQQACAKCAIGKYGASLPGSAAVNPDSEAHCVTCGLEPCSAGEIRVDGCSAPGTAFDDSVCVGGCLAGFFRQPGNDSIFVCDTCGEPKTECNCVMQESIKCSRCPRGKFQDELNQNSCKSCPTGKFANEAGAPNCLECTVGKYYIDASSACKPCQEGRFQAKTSMAECFSCPSGKYQASSGSFTCNDCPTGQYRGTGMGTGVSCYPCAAGRFQSQPGQSSCAPCGIGHYQPNTARMLCARCPAGKYHDGNATDRTACAGCTPGRYQSLAGSASCASCSKGQFEASNASAGCSLCAPGTSGSDAAYPTACVPCQLGKYSSLEGEIECKKCNKGFYQDDTQQTYCKGCAKGQYAVAEGVAACITCALGMFATTDANYACAECTPGRYQDGSSPMLGCKKCERGQYQGGEGARSCRLCTIGKYAHVTGLTECATCEAGRHYTNISMPCASCEAGRFQPGFGRASCNVCPKGKYQPVAGSTTCMLCGIGMFQDGSGLTSECGMCVPGMYQSELGSESCEKCPAGQYTEDSYRNTGCQKCPQHSTAFGETLSVTRHACYCHEAYYSPQFTNDTSLQCNEHGEPCRSAKECAREEFAFSCDFCMKCPKEADCARYGLRITSLSLKAGYWRATEHTTEVHKCPISGSCKGGIVSAHGSADHQCSAGYTGPLCSICADDHSWWFTKCKKCDTTHTIYGLVLTIAMVAVFLCLIVLAFRWHMRHVTRQGEHATTLTREFVDILQASAMQETIRLQQQLRILQKMKILVSYVQCTYRMGSVFRIQFPSAVANYYRAIGAALFNWVPYLPIGCAMNNDYYLGLYAMTIGPVFAVAVLLSFEAYSNAKAGRPKTDFRTSPSAVLILTFAVYVAVCTSVLEYFHCEELEDGQRYLIPYKAIRCTDGSYKAIRPYVVLMAVLYAVGTPVIYMILLWWHRDGIQAANRATNADIQSILFLWGPYKKKWYCMEVWDMVRKFVLVCLPMLLPKTDLAVAIGTIWVLLSLMVYQTTQPHVDRDDDNLMQLTQYQMLATIYVGLLIKYEVIVTTGVTGTAVSALLIGSSASVFGYCLYLIIHDTSRWTKLRKFYRRRFNRHRVDSISVMSLMPVPTEKEKEPSTVDWLGDCEAMMQEQRAAFENIKERFTCQAVETGLMDWDEALEKFNRAIKLENGSGLQGLLRQAYDQIKLVKKAETNYQQSLNAHAIWITQNEQSGKKQNFKKAAKAARGPAAAKPRKANLTIEVENASGEDDISATAQGEGQGEEQGEGQGEEASADASDQAFDALVKSEAARQLAMTRASPRGGAARNKKGTKFNSRLFFANKASPNHGPGTGGWKQTAAAKDEAKKAQEPKDMKQQSLRPLKKVLKDNLEKTKKARAAEQAESKKAAAIIEQKKKDRRAKAHASSKISPIPVLSAAQRHEPLRPNLPTQPQPLSARGESSNYHQRRSSAPVTPSSRKFSSFKF